jgi:hypothetical protein
MVFGVGLAACAGRDPHPVAVVQPQDVQSDCAMIQAEIQANNVQAEKLADENHAKIAQNVAAGVVGVVIWPVWFAMDAKGAAGTEMDALKARQQYLSSLAEQRCAPPPAPPQPPPPPRHVAAKPKPKPPQSSAPAAAPSPAAVQSPK